MQNIVNMRMNHLKYIKTSFKAHARHGHVLNLQISCNIILMYGVTTVNQYVTSRYSLAIK